MKHLPTMICGTLPHNKQRWDTAGDYEKIDENWFFSISEMENKDYEFLVLMHELTEFYLTQKRGISEPSIFKFDTKGVFKLDPKNADDPGVSKFAPYHDEHMFATKIEKLIAKELGVDWKEYDRQFEDLVYKKDSN